MLRLRRRPAGIAGARHRGSPFRAWGTCAERAGSAALNLATTEAADVSAQIQIMRNRTAAPGVFSGANRSPVALEHDPEKWIPVFGKDHAQRRSWSGMTIRRKVIPL